jgi:hypothetical protein
MRREDRPSSGANVRALCSVSCPPALLAEAVAIVASEDGFRSRERQPKPSTSPTNPSMPTRRSIGGLPREGRRWPSTDNRRGPWRAPFFDSPVWKRHRIMMFSPSKPVPGWFPTHNGQPHVRGAFARFLSVFPMPESVRVGRTLITFTVATLMRHLPGRMFRSRNRQGLTRANHAIGRVPFGPT